ncbi:MAG: hypothetical protein K0U54_01700, partial [Bacteroidetes bacterium]|nr:hypothetical protein [Bacteroidota bacterium]
MSITLVVISILSVQMVKAQYKVDAELVESSKYKSPTTVQAEYSYARGQRFYSYKNDIECFSLSSEFESTLALAPHLTMYLNGTYTYGRERTITMTQDYLPNTSNLSLLGGISIYNTNN